MLTSSLVGFVNNSSRVLLPPLLLLLLYRERETRSYSRTERKKIIKALILMDKHRKFVENIIKPFGLSFQSKESRRNEKSSEKIAIKEHKAFPYKTLSDATENFSPKNKLGEGGYGPVYKGVLMDGREIAVKKLSSGSKQGAKEFMNEASLLSRVQHRNVVNLYGYCADTIYGPNGQQQQEKLLVYEYVHHESLDKTLFKKKEKLNWKQRFDIIVGIARGLLYLHKDSPDTIIHRDIKAGNILLNEKWEPKIADFGMARLYPEGETHVLTRVAGTNGYMAPEYVMNGQLSTKADVFSFGVLVLELISGQKSSTFIPDLSAQSLLEWAWRLHRKGQSLEVLDATLASTASADQVVMCVQIGLLCVQAEPKLRPDMSRVFVLLSKKPGTTAAVEPARPGFSVSTHRSSRGARNSGSGTTSSVANSSSDSRSTSRTASNTNTL